MTGPSDSLPLDSVCLREGESTYRTTRALTNVPRTFVTRSKSLWKLVHRLVRGYIQSIIFIFIGVCLSWQCCIYASLYVFTTLSEFFSFVLYISSFEKKSYLLFDCCLIRNLTCVYCFTSGNTHHCRLILCLLLYFWQHSSLSSYSFTHLFLLFNKDSVSINVCLAIEVMQFLTLPHIMLVKYVTRMCCS